VLPATRHKWTRPAITPANQAGTWFTYPRGMDGWVDLGSLIAARPGIEPTTAWLQVRCPNHYATESPTHKLYITAYTDNACSTGYPSLAGWHIPERVTFKLCVTVYKCLQGMGPTYLSQMCRPISSVAGRHHLGSADLGQLVVPRYRWWQKSILLRWSICMEQSSRISLGCYTVFM